MLKHRFGVSWWIGIHFSQKKVTENYEMYVAVCLYRGYVCVHPTGKCTDLFV